MDRRRNKERGPSFLEDSLLPPTRRLAAANYLGPQEASAKRRSRKWSLDDFFRRISFVLDARSSSTSSDSLPARTRVKGRPEVGYAAGQQHRDSGGSGSGERVAGAMSLQTLEALLGRLAERAAAPEPSRRRGRLKARAEAMRERLPDSSREESSCDEIQGSAVLLPAPPPPPPRPREPAAKRRSRASRTERYLRRMWGGAAAVEGDGLRVPEESDRFRPIDRVPRSTTNGGSSGDVYLKGRYEEAPRRRPGRREPERAVEVGVNPLVQQTLQYFSEFDRTMAAGSPQQQQQQPPPPRRREVEPPKPPSRDHRSRLVTAAPGYQHMLRPVYPDKENGPYARLRVRCVEDNVPCRSPVPPASPLRDSLNLGIQGAIDRNHSPLLDINKAKYLERSSPGFSPLLQSDERESPVCASRDRQQLDGAGERRSSKNLEEALCELEAIYNSLQLGDEELLERADRRTMEEFHYKGFTASPDGFGNEDPASRRKTWGDSTPVNYKEESEIPDRLKDDMAYRRMHPKAKSPPNDGQSSLTSISYLMTSPIPSRREMRFIDPKRKPRRKEPDITLDDVVFRSMQHANSTLKVVEPQPPFGIPLGPITTATESDYLHTRPMRTERSRSPYIPNCEPDLVTDDLAFRNLRKDAQPSIGSRQASPSSFVSGSASPLSFGLKKKRAVRSLSANLYGLVNQGSASPPDPDSEERDSVFDDGSATKSCNGRRISDPEIMGISWETGAWKKHEAPRLNGQTCKRNSSDLDQSNRSCEDSSDERLPPSDFSPLVDRDTELKASSEKGSSYISSSCSTPPPVPSRPIDPFTEQEISVYKKLCQDLENLVQLTKGIDAVPVPNEPLPDLPPPPLEEPAGDSNLPAPERLSVKEIIEGAERATDDSSAREEASSLKCDISSILDGLKDLAIETPRIGSGCTEDKTAVATTTEALQEITKESCVMEEVRPQKPEKKRKKDKGRKKDKESRHEVQEQEEVDCGDRLDENLFFRNVQLAKLSGEWKESTPSGTSYSAGPEATLQRRTSLTGDGNWEGEIRPYERVSTVCNASYDMSRLTAKYICYITNHITAQFCLLLLFLFVLLLAIVTVP